MPLINCEINHILTCSENCVITSKATRDAYPDEDPEVAAVNNPTNATREIKDAKLYVPKVTLSTEDDNKLLEQLKWGYKRTVNWNNYRSEMTKPTKAKNLNYLIDPTFIKANQLFVLSFENEDDKKLFSKYYTREIVIKYFNVLIDVNSFFEVPVKNKDGTYEKIIEMSKTSGYTTGNLLDHEYFLKHYKLIAIDLSRQIELENPDLQQKINFIGKLEEDEETLFFFIEKSEETTFELLQNSVSIT